MFKSGEIVYGIPGLLKDKKPGIIRARYRRHYLVSWPDWRGYTYCHERELISANSPQLRHIADLIRRRWELDSNYSDELIKLSQQIEQAIRER